MQRAPSHLPAPGSAASPCPSDDVIFSLALGELDASEQKEAEEHVRTCPDCREVLSEALRSLGGESRPSEANATNGPVRLDRYELREPIGSGGAGVVYLAFDPALQREVAIKILRPDLHGADLHGADPHGRGTSFQERLRREARATAQLSHPNVVTAYDVGATEAGVFIVLEYLSGGTLEEWLRGEHSIDERLDKLREAGLGLAAAHDKGLVHRDFKPQNVLLGDDGRVCVTDFGLARFERIDDEVGFRMDSTVESATQTRGLMGTPLYMAPETFTGSRGDERSDQYSFCVALYRALNDRHPFRGTSRVTLEELLTRMQSGLVDPCDPAVPEHVRAVLERGLSADPAARFSSMRELLAALTPTPSRRLPRLLAAAAGFGLVGLGAWVAIGPDEASDLAAARITSSSKVPEGDEPSASPASRAESTNRTGASPVADDETGATTPEGQDLGGTEPDDEHGDDRSSDAGELEPDGLDPDGKNDSTAAASPKVRKVSRRAAAPRRSPSTAPPKTSAPADDEPEETRYDDRLRDPF